MSKLLRSSLSLILSHVVSLVHLLGDLLDGLGYVIGKVEVPHLLRGDRDNGKCLLVFTLVSQTNLKSKQCKHGKSLRKLLGKGRQHYFAYANLIRTGMCGTVTTYTDHIR